ncbi:MAG: hypothetical protein QG608_1369, partial [Actinomycetota bacterium]|nr:hypothetical protein [Actinomycetota bacterium]
PVNDVFWVEAVDDHGNTVEGHPLFSTRDRLGGQEQYTEPSRRQALQELIEDKGLPGFPRNEKNGFSPRRCQEAATMHVPEGLEQLVHKLLKLDDQNGKG